MRDFDDPDWESPEDDPGLSRRPLMAGQASRGARFMQALFMVIFMGIFMGAGLTVLVHVWSATQFGIQSIPVFFRLFASFIALAFVLIGLRGVIAALSGMSPHRGSAYRTDSKSAPRIRKRKTSYVCRHCGATLESGADVSPSGDVKCSYCDSWFNIHH